MRKFLFFFFKHRCCTVQKKMDEQIPPPLQHSITSFNLYWTSKIKNTLPSLCFSSVIIISAPWGLGLKGNNQLLLSTYFSSFTDCFLLLNQQTIVNFFSIACCNTSPCRNDLRFLGCECFHFCSQGKCRSFSIIYQIISLLICMCRLNSLLLKIEVFIKICFITLTYS